MPIPPKLLPVMRVASAALTQTFLRPAVSLSLMGLATQKAGDLIVSILVDDRRNLLR